MGTSLLLLFPLKWRDVCLYDTLGRLAFLPLYPLSLWAGQIRPVSLPVHIDHAVRLCFMQVLRALCLACVLAEP